MRGGGSECEDDSSREMTLTIDVWCNPDYAQLPQDIQILNEMDEEPTDPCNIYISMQHDAGCIFWDMRPFLRVVGLLMIGGGAILMIFGMEYQKLFMRLLVRLAVFAVCIVFFYKLHFFDPIDPTVLSRMSAVEGYLLTIIGIILAFVAQYVAGIVFKKSLRFGPTLLGCVAGWWFAIYLIMGINGMAGIFTSGSADFISPLWSAILEVMGVILGGAVGNMYSLVFLIAVQTFISAYLIMRGCTMISNWGYPNEVAMMNAATSETNSLIHLGWMFYFYMVWLFAMWLAAFQY